MTKQRLNNIFFFVGVAAVVVMLFTFDISFAELWQHLCRAGYWLVPIIGIWAVVYAINAWSWWCIIRSQEKKDEIENPNSVNLKSLSPESVNRKSVNRKSVSPLRVYRLTITGYALNYATPVGGLGGEPYRILELSKDIGTERATSSVILYAMMHIFSHFWFWFTSVFLYLALAAIGDMPFTTAIGITFVVITAFCLLAFYVFSKGYRKGLVVRMIRWTGKLPGLKRWSARFLDNHEESLRNVDHQIAALHGQDKRAFYNSLLLEYFSRVVQSLEIMFMLLLFDIDCGGGLSGLTLTFLHSILILALTSLLANLLGFLPMQLGVQEGGFVVSTAAMGLSAAMGIFIGIICRVREIIWIFIGMMLMKLK